MNPSDRKFQTALALIQAHEQVRLQQAQAPLVETRPEPLRDYDETFRLTLSSVATKAVEARAGFRGWLVGITVFVDAIDTNDTFSVMLKGRKLKDAIRPRANFSIEQDFTEEVEPHDRITLVYNSTGTTTKNIDFTPRVRFPRP